MKILITTDWYKPVLNGVVTSVVNLSRELSDMGHEIKILTLSNTRRSSIVNEEIYYVRSVRAGLIYPEARVSASARNRCVRELIEWKPDIIHSQCEFSSFHIALRIAKKTGCPIVHTYHTVYEDYVHYIPMGRLFGSQVVTGVSRWLLEKTNHVIVPSTKVKELLKGYGITKPISVIPTGIDLSRFLQTDKATASEIRKTYNLNDDDTVLLILGRLAKEKNIEELLTYFANRLKQKSKDNRESREKIMLVGGGPYLPTLAALIDKLGISDHIIIVGRVKQSQVPSYYHACDIFICASTSETQGLTYAEAMASGIPLLCRDDDAINSVIVNDENGFLYTGEEEFNEMLDKLSDDPDLRHRIGSAGQSTATELYSKESFATEVLKVYESECRGATSHAD